jgi:hypothetical protein
MKVNGLTLPEALQRALTDGTWKNFSEWKKKEHKQKFKAIFPGDYSPWPFFFDYDWMVRENECLLDVGSAVQFYLGEKSEMYPPGDIDPKATVLIGGTEADSPIALDYRCNPPRVIYMNDVGTKTLWIEAARSIEEILNRLRRPSY